MSHEILPPEPLSPTDLDAELNRVMAVLDVPSGEVPEDALRQAQRHREAIIPRLIAAIETATRLTRQGRPPEGNAHWFALFLLAEFRAKEALPAILESVSLPGEQPFDLYSDAITERLPGILGTLTEDAGVLDAMIANRDVNEYVRWQAVEAYLQLVRDERLTRDEAITRLRGHLQTAVAERDEEIADGLASTLASLVAVSALPDIRRAYELGLANPEFASLSYYEEVFAAGEDNWQQVLTKRGPKLIDDTVAEMGFWFQSGTPRSDYASSLDNEEEDHDSEPIDDQRWYGENTIRYANEKVGRNEPCPCGSGKKFKRCCGGG